MNRKGHVADVARTRGNIISAYTTRQAPDAGRIGAEMRRTSHFSRIAPANGLANGTNSGPASGKHTFGQLPPSGRTTITFIMELDGARSQSMAIQ